ncbi:MAG: hypothetical protein HQK54_12220 [Oligoflexales bacterium]|nr:hypothetical protein [Oligoflexales bacterium]
MENPPEPFEKLMTMMKKTIMNGRIKKMCTYSKSDKSKSKNRKQSSKEQREKEEREKMEMENSRVKFYMDLKLSEAFALAEFLKRIDAEGLERYAHPEKHDEIKEAFKKLKEVLRY